MGIISIFLIILISFLFCNNKNKINFRTVGLSFLLLVLFSIFIFTVPIGIKIIQFVAHIANVVLEQGQVGARFIFGNLASNQGFVFATAVLVNVIFLGALFAALYYLKIMQPINSAISYLLSKMLKTSKAETLSSIITIFLGPGEAQLAIKPFLPHLTKSEMFTIMVSGFAAVSGSVMGGYIALGMPATYIISAIFMTIPSSIFIAKLMYPETENIYEYLDKIQNEKLPEEKATSIIEAIAIGAYCGLKVAIAIGIMIISFVSLIALVNVILVYFGDIMHIHNLTLQKILGVILAPFAYLLGVPLKETVIAGSIIGEKTITNELVAFLHLKEYMATLSPKTQIILIFSVCGFANIGTMGMFIGTIQAIIPEKVKEFSQMSVKALLAASMANLLNGAIAGIMFDVNHLFH